MQTKVAVVQMTSGPDVTVNLDAAETFVRRAAAERARLVVLPECFAYLGPEAGKVRIAEPLPAGGPILRRFATLAHELELEILLGGFWEQSPEFGKVRNTSVLLGPDGQVRALYRKIHLFDVDLADGTSLRESDTTEPGDQAVVAESCLGKLGLSICYDVRFPELYRRLVDGGAVALAVPAAFTLTTGKEHWHALLRARAIESQCYVLAAAQTGTHFGSRTSYGHALICDPWGTVVAECSEGPGVITAVVDTERVAKVRAQLPSLRHRRIGAPAVSP